MILIYQKKANIVFIEGDTIKAICDKGIYLLENGNWKLKRIINENDTSKYIDQITYIFNNDGNEFDPMKYVYNICTKKVDVYLNVNNTHPAEIIGDVDDFSCNSYGAACFKRGNELYIKPTVHLNPFFVSYIKYDFNDIGTIEDIVLTDDSICYCVLADQKSKKYKIMYINLNYKKELLTVVPLDTKVTINNDYKVKVKNNYFFFIVELGMFSKDMTDTKFYFDRFAYVVDRSEDPFLIRVTNENKNKYGLSEAELGTYCDNI